MSFFDAWGRAWGESWGLSWGLTYEANQDETLFAPGGGDSKPKRKKEKPGKALDDKDMLEVMTIIFTTGLLNHGAR